MLASDYQLRADQEAVIAAARRARALSAQKEEEEEKRVRRIQLQVFVHAR